MGSYVSASFGYGIVLPDSDDDEDYEPNAWVHEILDEGDGWYEVAEALAQEFGLTYDTVYVHDYSHGTVLFAPSASLHSYDAIKKFPDYREEGSVPLGELEGLENAARKVGIPYEPSWILTASYG